MSSGPFVFSKLAPLKTSEVYDTYWQFAAERQEIFFRRLNRHSPPWSEDEVLSRYKFTNCYRAADRVSQYLIRHVIYEGSQEPEEVFFRIILFKLFNKIETWELFKSSMEEISYRSYSYKVYDRILSGAMQRGITIYSAAYLMASGSRAFRVVRKHQAHLRLLEMMMKNRVSSTLLTANNLVQVFELLRSYPLIGDFLAYQYAIDINYSTLVDFSEMSFVMPGPGARDGIKKCFISTGGLSDADVIKVVTERQNLEFARLGISFRSLWGRSLQLIDCQNLFCEVDKYARIVHPEVKGISGRSRIKQLFRPKQSNIEYWFPPKWEINTLIQNKMSSSDAKIAV
ncbi:MAG: nucleotide kinase domain-containing protein [Candidatus Saccharimonadales bacterium]